MFEDHWFTVMSRAFPPKKHFSFYLFIAENVFLLANCCSNQLLFQLSSMSPNMRYPSVITYFFNYPSQIGKSCTQSHNSVLDALSTFR